VTNLDIAIAQDEEFNLIRLNILALPKPSEESNDSFLVSGSANQSPAAAVACSYGNAETYLAGLRRSKGNSPSGSGSV
jgi:hypothetical protein